MLRLDRSPIRLLGFALLGLLAVGCAPKRGKPEEPRPTDAATIESELVRNESALRDAGIWVPPPPAPGTTTTSPRPEEELPTASPEEPLDVGTSIEAPPSDAPATDYDDEDDSAPSLDSRRDERETALRAEPPRTAKRRGRHTRSFAKKQRREQSTRCDRICELAEATCELHEHICRLAEAHPDEPRYEASCLRAEQQCQAADEACRACEG